MIRNQLFKALEHVRVTDEDDCRDLFIRLRWPDGVPRCPRCNNSHVRATAEGFTCGPCGKPFSPKFGSVFHGSHLNYAAIMTACKHVSLREVSIGELSRLVRVTYPTAQTLKRRILDAIARGTIVGSDLEADPSETEPEEQEIEIPLSPQDLEVAELEAAINAVLDQEPAKEEIIQALQGPLQSIEIAKDPEEQLGPSVQSTDGFIVKRNIGGAFIEVYLPPLMRRKAAKELRHVLASIDLFVASVLIQAEA